MLTEDKTACSSNPTEDFKYLIKGWKEEQVEQNSRPGSTVTTKVCELTKVDTDSQ